MSIVDDLVANLVERNAIALNGALVIELLDGGIKITGTIVSTLRDQRRNKDILQVNIPVDANVKVGDIVVPVPNQRASYCFGATRQHLRAPASRSSVGSARELSAKAASLSAENRLRGIRAA